LGRAEVVPAEGFGKEDPRLTDTLNSYAIFLVDRHRYADAEPVYERFCSELRVLGVPVVTGVFGARMAVELVNDGPVTIVVP